MMHRRQLRQVLRLLRLLLPGLKAKFLSMTLRRWSSGLRRSRLRSGFRRATSCCGWECYVGAGNLAPRKLRGLESNGMIVAASVEGGRPVLAGFLEDVEIGARLK